MKSWIAGLLLVGAATVSAQPQQRTTGSALVVNADWVAQHLTDLDLVILHVGDKATYDAGHLPGARFADLRTLAVSGSDAASGLTLEMPPDSVLRDRLAALGISDSSHIVVYASDGRWTQSTRVVLTLDRAGLANVSWMDGGLGAWKEAARPTVTEVPAVNTGTLSPLKVRPIVVDSEYVTNHKATPGVAIVDARDVEFYDGTRKGGNPPTAGHIPGAVSLPYTTFLSGDRLKSPDEIRAAFSRAGVKPGDTVVGYCHIGQQATTTLFAARVAGYRVLLYDGSFEDWTKRGLPTEIASPRLPPR